MLSLRQFLCHVSRRWCHTPTHPVTTPHPDFHFLAIHLQTRLGTKRLVFSESHQELQGQLIFREKQNVAHTTTRKNLHLIHLGFFFFFFFEALFWLKMIRGYSTNVLKKMSRFILHHLTIWLKVCVIFSACWLWRVIICWLCRHPLTFSHSARFESQRSAVWGRVVTENAACCGI